MESCSQVWWLLKLTAKQQRLSPDQLIDLEFQKSQIIQQNKRTKECTVTLRYNLQGNILVMLVYIVQHSKLFN